jgi:hypothetical protein
MKDDNLIPLLLLILTLTVVTSVIALVTLGNYAAGMIFG